jgi:hypothetical protein
MATISLIIGIALLVVTVLLFRWGTPKGEKPSPVPNKWGMGTMFPIALLCLGMAGVILLVKGIYP